MRKVDSATGINPITIEKELSMQTIEQLLSKVLDLIEEARQRGEKPELVFLTPDDEHTLAVHAWLRAKDDRKPDALHEAPPDVRSSGHGYSRLADLQIQWDSEKTEVRARTPAELTAHQEECRRSTEAIREVNQRLAELSRQRRNRLW